MGLVEHAREELKRAGLFDEDSDYGGAVGNAVMRLIEVMAADGHSGGSAHVVLSAFDKVVRGKPLTPLTSDPSEWMDVADAVPGKSPGVWQNRRAFSVFSEDGGKTWYDLDGVLAPSKEAYLAGKRAVTVPLPSDGKIVRLWYDGQLVATGEEACKAWLKDGAAEADDPTWPLATVGARIRAYDEAKIGAFVGRILTALQVKVLTVQPQEVSAKVYLTSVRDGVTAGDATAEALRVLEAAIEEFDIR